MLANSHFTSAVFEFMNTISGHYVSVCMTEGRHIVIQSDGLPMINPKDKFVSSIHCYKDTHFSTPLMLKDLQSFLTSS